MKFIRLSILFAATLGQGWSKDSTIEDWNAEFLAAVRRQAPPPCLVARNLAIFHLSIWRAVEGSKADEQDSAAKGAAHEVAVTLFAGDRSGFDALFRDQAPDQEEAAKAGRVTAIGILKEREDDGSSTTIHYKPDIKAGIWQRTTENRPPEMPHWALVRPFFLGSAAQFRPPPPPPLNSAEYAKAVEEVRTVGGKDSASRTDEQELIARFWSDFSYTSSPPGRWNEIACSVMKDLRLYEKARLLAILNVAMADSSIAAWDCKYHYRLWRPVHAIRESFDDGNGATIPDRTWQSLLLNPSHPEYVSGHSVFSGAAAPVLANRIKNLTRPIIVSNRDNPGVSRSYQSFEEIAAEISKSRVYGGIHFRFSGEEGLLLGRKVAEYALKQFGIDETKNDEKPIQGDL